MEFEPKICTKCKVEKQPEEFRVRQGRRAGDKSYLSPPCKECESIAARMRYKKIKDNPEVKKRNRKRTNEYRKRAGYGKRRWQAVKNDPTRKAKIKKWREENPESVKVNQKKRGLEWHRKNCDNITDTYVIMRLQFQFKGMTAESILANPHLMEIKRDQIILYRYKLKILEHQKQLLKSS